jgi:RNA polymerase sigma factor (sigma-70 family)
MYRVAINVAISYYRKNLARKNSQISLTEHTENTAPIQDMEDNNSAIQLKLLEQFINELKEFDKALILLYLEDKSHVEIADIIGITVGNVGTKIGRIKDKLRLRFSQLNIQ